MLLLTQWNVIYVDLPREYINIDINVVHSISKYL